MAIKSIGMPWITVSDMKKTEEFFKHKLGLSVTSHAPEFGWMEFAGKDGGLSLGTGMYSPEYSDQKAGSNAVVCFNVDDIVATKAELEAKGVTFVDEIMEVPGHVKLVTFVDNDGNRFQLAEQLSN